MGTTQICSNILNRVKRNNESGLLYKSIVNMEYRRSVFLFLGKFRQAFVKNLHYCLDICFLVRLYGHRYSLHE